MSKLPVRHERFLQLYVQYHLNGVPMTEAKYKAYVDVYGKKKTGQITKLRASQLYSKLKQELNQELLDYYGLGRDRLLLELNKRLEAKKPIVSRGEIIDYVPDEGVRMAATQLLADINKMRGPHTEININSKNQTLIVEVMSEEETQKYMEKVKELEQRARGEYA